MRKLLGIVTLSSLCLALGFGATGCQKASDKFKTDKSGQIKAKGDNVTYTFNREVKSVTPDKSEGVKWTKEGKKVTFTMEEDLPDAEKTAKFTVKGGADADKEDVSITIPAKSKTDGGKTPPDKTPPAAEDLAAMGALPTEMSFNKAMAEKNATTIKFSKGKVDSVTVDPADKGVTAEKVSDSEVKITVTDKANAGDMVTVKVKAAGDKKGIDIPIKIGAPMSFFHHRNDQRIFNSARHLAMIVSNDQSVFLNRRI